MGCQIKAKESLEMWLCEYSTMLPQDLAESREKDLSARHTAPPCHGVLLRALSGLVLNLRKTETLPSRRYPDPHFGKPLTHTHTHTHTHTQCARTLDFNMQVHREKTETFRMVGNKLQEIFRETKYPRPFLYLALLPPLILIF